MRRLLALILVLVCFAMPVTATTNYSSYNTDELARLFYIWALGSPSAAATYNTQELARTFYSTALNTAASNIVYVPSQYSSIQTAINAVAAVGANASKPYTVLAAPGVSMVFTPVAGVNVVPIASLATSHPSLGGFPISTVTRVPQNSSVPFTQVTASTGRGSCTYWYIPKFTTTFRAVFGNILNFADPTQVSPNPIQVKAAAKINGVVYPLTFGENIGEYTRIGTIQPGQLLSTTELPVSITAGTTIEVRCWAYSHNVGDLIPGFSIFNFFNSATSPGGGSSYQDRPYAADHVDDATAPARSDANDTYMPITVIGQFADPTQVSVAMIGDSITGRWNYYDYNTYIMGYAIGDSTIPRLIVGLSGCTDDAYMQSPMLKLVEGYPVVICALGRNMVGGTPNDADIKRRFQAVWARIKSSGSKVYQTTLTPLTTDTTDTTTTRLAANQTASQPTEDATINAWFATQVTAGNLDGVIDWAQYVSATNGSGQTVWADYLTQDGTHPNVLGLGKYGYESGRVLMAYAIDQTKLGLPVPSGWKVLPPYRIARLDMNNSVAAIAPTEYEQGLTITMLNPSYQATTVPVLQLPGGTYVRRFSEGTQQFIKIAGVNAPGGPSQGGGSSYTVMFWLRIWQAPTIGNACVCIDNSGNQAFRVYLNASDSSHVQLSFRVADATPTTIIVPLNAWLCCSLAVDTQVTNPTNSSVDATLNWAMAYIHGITAQPGTPVAAYNSGMLSAGFSDLWIGNYSGSDTTNIDIGDIVIVRRAVSPIETELWYTGTKARYGL